MSATVISGWQISGGGIREANCLAFNDYGGSASGKDVRLATVAEARGKKNQEVHWRRLSGSSAWVQQYPENGLTGCDASRRTSSNQ